MVESTDVGRIRALVAEYASGALKWESFADALLDALGTKYRPELAEQLPKDVLARLESVAFARKHWLCGLGDNGIAEDLEIADDELLLMCPRMLTAEEASRPVRNAVVRNVLEAARGMTQAEKDVALDRAFAAIAGDDALEEDERVVLRILVMNALGFPRE